MKNLAIIIGADATTGARRRPPHTLLRLTPSAAAINAGAAAAPVRRAVG
jgi:hypothetical protein